MSTLAPSFLIGSSSYLQVTRTSITSRMSLIFGQIGPRTAELATLQRLEKSPIGLRWGKFCEHSSSFIFESIILILAGNEDMHESLDEFKFWPDISATNSRVIASIFYRIFFILAGNEDIHNISDEFEIRPELSALACLKS